MLATVINCLLILIGSALGLLLKGKLPQRFLDVLVQALGLCVLSIEKHPLRGGLPGPGHHPGGSHQH